MLMLLCEATQIHYPVRVCRNFILLPVRQRAKGLPFLKNQSMSTDDCGPEISDTIVLSFLQCDVTQLNLGAAHLNGSLDKALRFHCPLTPCRGQGSSRKAEEKDEEKSKSEANCYKH